MMSTAANKALVSAFYETANRGDIDACLDLLAPDVAWINTGSTAFAGRFEGKETVIRELIGPLFGQLVNGIHSTVDLLVAEGEHVVALTRGTAMTQAGKQYNNTYCHVFRVVDGRITEVTEYLDTALANEVFGR
jgi:ketosteroid isomerase-like protein